MSTHDLHRLARDVRWLKRYAAVATLAIGALLLTAARQDGGDGRFKTLRTERLAIVDAKGTTRLLLVSPDTMPGPAGPESPAEGKRNISSSGIIFYNETGKESGGFVVGKDVTERGGLVSAMLFDYDRTEAGGFFRRTMPDQSGFAGLFINDPAPPGMSQKEAINKDWARIRIQNPDKNAEILLADPQGRTRIQLRVDNQGEARIEVLDADGKVTFRAPDAVAATR